MADARFMTLDVTTGQLKRASANDTLLAAGAKVSGSAFTVDMVNATDSTLQVVNSGAGAANLSVENMVSAAIGSFSTKVVSPKLENNGNIIVDAIGASDTTISLTNSGAGNAIVDMDKLSIGGTQYTGTAGNLNSLTNGSNADALHTHSAVDSDSTKVDYSTGATAIGAGEVVYQSTTADQIDKAQANASGTSKVVGVAPLAIGATSSGKVQSTGLVDIKFEASLTLANGDHVFLSKNTAGYATNVPPSADGEFIVSIGIIRDKTAYTGVAGDLAEVDLNIGMAIAL